MIRINLLRQTIVPRAHRQALMAARSAFMLLFLFVGMFMTVSYIGTAETIRVYEAETTRVEEFLQRLFPGERLTAGDLSLKVRELAPVLTAIDQVASGRRPWSHNLAAIAAALPPEAWIESVETRAITGQQQLAYEFIKDDGRKKIEPAAGIEIILRSVVKDTGPEHTIQAFVESITTDLHFMRGISGIKGKVVSSEIQSGQRVALISIICLLDDSAQVNPGTTQKGK
jgi:hypothetical protein